MMISNTENLRQENEFLKRALRESLTDNDKLAAINAELVEELELAITSTDVVQYGDAIHNARAILAKAKSMLVLDSGEKLKQGG